MIIDTAILYEKAHERHKLVLSVIDFRIKRNEIRSSRRAELVKSASKEYDRTVRAIRELEKLTLEMTT